MMGMESAAFDARIDTAFKSDKIITVEGWPETDPAAHPGSAGLAAFEAEAFRKYL